MTSKRTSYLKTCVGKTLVAAAIAFSSYFCANTALAAKCGYTVTALSAGKDDDIKYTTENGKPTDKVESVTLYVPTPKGVMLAVSVPGEFVEGLKPEAVEQRLLANVEAAVDGHLKGKESDSWECKEKTQGDYTELTGASTPPTSGKAPEPPAAGPATKPPGPAPVPPEVLEAQERTKVLDNVLTIVKSQINVFDQAAAELSKGNLTDFATNSVKSKFKAQEESVLLAMYAARTKFNVLPVYESWSRACALLQNEVVSEDDLTQVKKHLDAALAMLNKLAPADQIPAALEVRAREVIERIYRFRNKISMDAKTQARVAEVQAYVEQVYKAYLENRDLNNKDKEVLLSQKNILLEQLTQKDGGPDKVEMRAKNRELVKLKKPLSYTPQPNGSVVNDEDALNTELSKVRDDFVERAAPGINGLGFSCVLNVRIKVNKQGRAASVAFEEGPRSYLDAPELLQKLTDVLGRYVFPKSDWNKNHLEFFTW